jgi:hypothetical protein
MSLGAGAKRPAARGLLSLVLSSGLRERNRARGKVEILLLDFHFSMGAVVGAVGMWESRLWRFPRAVGGEGKPAFGFPRRPQPVISTALCSRFASIANVNFILSRRGSVGKNGFPKGKKPLVSFPLGYRTASLAPHARRFPWMLPNSFCLAACIAVAAAVSVFARALCSKS